MRLLILLLLLLPSRLVAQTIAGTYALWLCSSDCAVADTADAPVAGYLVLSDDTLRTSALPQGTREALKRESSFLLLQLGAVWRILPPTACFSLTERASGARLPRGAAFTVWSAYDGTLSVRLRASPDAFYTVTAVVSGESLLGAGRRHGYIGWPFDEEVGPVHGLRVGPPDMSRCTPFSGLP